MKAVVAALSAALATACTSSNGATTPTPTASSTSATPTATSTTASLQDAARTFYAEASQAMATGEVARLQELITPDCSCQQLVRYITEKWSGGSIRGGQFVVHEIGSPTLDGQVVVPVRRSTTAYEILDRSGNVLERGPADPAMREDLYFVQVGGSWKIKNVVVPR